jgi:hypothetical protein
LQNTLLVKSSIESIHREDIRLQGGTRWFVLTEDYTTAHQWNKFSHVEVWSVDTADKFLMINLDEAGSIRKGNIEDSGLLREMIDSPTGHPNCVRVRRAN